MAKLDGDGFSKEPFEPEERARLRALQRDYESDETRPTLRAFATGLKTVKQLLIISGLVASATVVIQYFTGLTK